MRDRLRGAGGEKVGGRLSFVVLLVSQLAATMGFTFVMPFMPLYMGELGVRDTGDAAAWAGLANAATAVTMALAAPFWGRVADRFGTRAMLLRATLAGAVVVGLMGLVSDPWQLLGLRALQGCLTGTVAAATVLVSATAPHERAGSRLGVLQMTIFVAASAGPFFGGTFADLVGIRPSFAVTAGLLAGSGALILVGVKGARPQAREAEEPGEDTEESPLPWRKLLPGLLALFAVQVAITGVAPVLPGFLSILRDSAEGIASLSGWVMMTGGLAAAVGSVFGGRLAARYGPRPVVLASLLIAGLAALPQAWSTSVALFWILHFTMSVFLGVVVPVANLAVREAVSERRQGAAFGVAASAVSTANGLGPLGAGLLAAALGFGAPFLVPAVLLIGVSVLLWVLPRWSVRRRLVERVIFSLKH